ncbi:hypothetical protein [Actinocorallia longicatena]|uniref:3-keto-disaccharide hydrolase domain-containing protein n=1 Tax=Actinocorallia longicatena TaxID=111803 RepID=A0ABP6QF00_9ACTN
MKRLVLSCAVVVLAATACSPSTATPDPVSAPTPAVTPPSPGEPLFSADLSGRNRLLTNEYAHWNKGKGVRSQQWDVTSGSLFLRDGVGWSGRPDAKLPDKLSRTGNNSSVFRMTTRQKNFRDVRVDLKLRNLGLSKQATSGGWDGVHLFLRWQSERDLYAVTLNRRDNTVVVKRKLPGGSSNGGHYAEIQREPYSVPEGLWQPFSVTIQNTGPTVTIMIFVNDRLILKAEDKGTRMPLKADRGPQITKAGAVGIRADNCEFEFSDFKVYAL